MEVHFETVGCLDEAVPLLREELRDPAVRPLFMALHIAPLLPRVVLELATHARSSRGTSRAMLRHYEVLH